MPFAFPTYHNYKTQAMKHIIPIMAASIIASACSQSGKTTQPGPAPAPTAISMPSTGSNAARPMAIVYSTDRDYTALVPIVMDDSRTRIVSYPDPKDLRHSALPTPLSDGYLLDLRGISPNTVFLTITCADYAAMPSPPSPDTLLAHISSLHPFTAMYTLPITAAEARRDPSLCDQYIANGFKGCKELLKVKKVKK